MRSLCALLVIMLPGIQLVSSQKNFDPAEYKLFLEVNKSQTAVQLLNSYPPQTVYYSSRENPANLKDIPWFDSINMVYNFTEKEQEMLANNFFMVSGRSKFWQWVYGLISVYSNDLPLFLSTDFVLYTLHDSYDKIFKTLEWQFLEPNLAALLGAMYDHYPVIYAKYSNDERFADALEDVDLYISVARSLLLNEKFYPQEHDPGKFNEILQDISGEQMTFTTLFTSTRNRKIDFSQFKPRGHYTETIYTLGGERTLENYFRAMMWLGRIDFLLTAPPGNPWEPDWTAEELLRMQLGAVLLNELLYSCGEMGRLEKHEQIISYLVGPDDNMTPGELKGLTDKILDTPTDLFDESIFSAFSDSLNASDDYGQKIMSDFFYVDPATADPGKLPVSFKLLGQKFLLDSYVMSEVVYDRIIFNGEKIYRGLPDPLDVMAVLGNEDAIALLENELETYKYAYKISSLKYLVDSYDTEFWGQSLYNTWLAAIRDLNPPGSSDNLPYFMQTTAWHHEKLNTQLTSWAMLRHDNILYAKPSGTGGTSCSFPYTYVEPYPDFYRRLQIFATNAADFYQAVLPDEQVQSKNSIIKYYNGYADIMDKFYSIAEKELAGIPLDDMQITFLKTMINAAMGSGPSITGWYNDLFFQNGGLETDFKVADVHTQPTDQFGNLVGYVLHVGNGYINLGVFLAPNPVNPAQLMAFIGPVSSFHQEVADNFTRYNDWEWSDRFEFGEGSIPSRPDWVALYLSGSSGQLLPEGRTLKGEIYTGTGTKQNDVINDLDYLLAFPVPVSDEVHLRFVLNRKTDVAVEIFDVSGRMISRPVSSELMPAEHDITLDISTWAKGMYLVRFRAGEKVLSREIMKF